MADEITPPSGETPGGAAPQGETPASTPPTGETPGSTTQTPADLQKEIERLSNSLKRANAEAKAEREAAAELKKYKEQVETERLTEQQKLEKRAAAAEKALLDKEQAYQSRLLQAEIRSQAAQLGIKYPDKAAKLIDTADIKADDDEMAAKVKDALQALLKEMPELGPQTQQQQRQAPTSGGATNPSRSQTGAPPALSWDVIGKMSPEEYALRRAEIQQYINANPHRYGRPTR